MADVRVEGPAVERGDEFSDFLTLPA